MNCNRFSGRELKKRVAELLKSEDHKKVLTEINRYQARQVVNPLLSFLYSGDPIVKWNSVISMGVVVSRLADEEIESARIIMRRLMWNLNDESGGIGWGAAEAMGEILASSDVLSDEYASILLSYARKDGNFQEYEYMQRGVLWGIGRFAEIKPGLVRDTISEIINYLKSSDAAVRGYAARIIGLAGSHSNQADLKHLLDDDAEIQTYVNQKLINCRVKDLAGQAMESLESKEV
jgi:HEAT repeat protein